MQCREEGVAKRGARSPSECPENGEVFSTLLGEKRWGNPKLWGGWGKWSILFGGFLQRSVRAFVTFFPRWHYPGIMKAFMQEVWVETSFTNHGEK